MENGDRRHLTNGSSGLAGQARSQLNRMLVKMKNNGDKMEKPKVSPGQWIWVQSRECVVCQEFQDTSIADIEVVHMDQGKATIETQNGTERNGYLPEEIWGDMPTVIQGSRNLSLSCVVAANII